MIRVKKSLKIFDKSSGGKEIGSTGDGSFTITKVEGKRGYLKSSTKDKPKWVALQDVPLVYIKEENTSTTKKTETKKETTTTKTSTTTTKETTVKKEETAKKESYLEKTAKGADKTYAEVVKRKCKHSGSPATNEFSQIKENRTITCNRAMSISLQEGECLPKGKLVAHTTPCKLNGSELLKKKNTIDKCMTGYKDLIKGTCTIYKAGCKFSALPDKYKAKGNCYIYDSDAAVSAGYEIVKDSKGKDVKKYKIYTCNESKEKQVVKDEKGVYRYVLDCVDSGYVFNHTILYVVSPKP
jgi:hypothetical protein